MSCSSGPGPEPRQTALVITRGLETDPNPGRVLLTRRNRLLAAGVPIEDIALLEMIEDREDVKAARAALREVKRTGTIPWTRIKKELGLN